MNTQLDIVAVFQFSFHGWIHHHAHVVHHLIVHFLFFFLLLLFLLLVIAPAAAQYNDEHNDDYDDDHGDNDNMNLGILGELGQVHLGLGEEHVLLGEFIKKVLRVGQRL